MPLRTAIAYVLLLTTLSGQDAPRKLESLLIQPEPRALRSSLSFSPAGAKLTVFTPARETAKGIEMYTAEAFQALGLSIETFVKRAAVAADKRLAKLKPEVIRDAEGDVLYAVNGGDSPLFSSLLIAPSLPKLFEPMFGPEVWAVLPDRHALYLFPANSPMIPEFTADLAERYSADPFAASPEIFALKAGEEIRVIAAFAGSSE